MSDAALVPGWSNRGSVPPEDQPGEPADAKRVEPAEVEDKSLRASRTRKK